MDYPTKNLVPRPLFCRVIIPLALPMVYTWSVPEEYRQQVQLGIRVEVSLRRKKYTGIIRSIFSETPAFETTPIDGLIDNEPILFDPQLRLWDWISDYYMCTEGEVMQYAIPSYLRLSAESLLIYNEEQTANTADLSDDEYILFEALQIKKQLKIKEAQTLLQKQNHYKKVLNGLLEKGICNLYEGLKDRYHERVKAFIRFSEKYRDEKNLEDLLKSPLKFPRQMELILNFIQLSRQNGTQEILRSELLKAAKAGSSSLSSLLDKNIFEQVNRKVDRLNYGNDEINLEDALSQTQQKALNEIHEGFKSRQVCLLKGITASGKTILYIKLIEEFLTKGGQALYLLPEIGITFQILEILKKRFSGNVAAYHSRLSPSERVEIWNKVRSGLIRVIIGSRSALFLPFEDLKFIVIDEEHDGSFKQTEPSPRFQARDTAIFYASIFKCKVLLGSATPSYESYYNALQGKYALARLEERFGGATLPSIQTINNRPNGHKGPVEEITPKMASAISETVKSKRQVLLFINRRGYAPIRVCSSCGYIPKCKHCDVSLTYHKEQNILLCHYCGTGYKLDTKCPRCGSSSFILKNTGTEKIEEMLREKFPHFSVARMDLDTMRGKNNFEQTIRLFENKKIDIIIGTQIIVKGLDFRDVGLVGIMDADSLLNFADFRVNEHAFQLLEQVSGRAGRTGEGKVLIQTSDPDNEILRYVIEHDYDSLYKKEIEEREIFHYPPFCRIVKITTRHRDKNIAEQTAGIIAEGIKRQFAYYLTGPSIPPIEKIRNLYMREIMLKLPKDTGLIRNVKQLIKKEIIRIRNIGGLSGVSIIINVDPN